MEYGYYHPDTGYWQTTSEPSPEIVATYPEGTISVPLKPGDLYEWQEGEWILVPLSPEEVRTAMPELLPREFRDALVDNGIFPDQVSDVISQLPDPTDRAKALNAWNYAQSFVRNDPLVILISTQMGLSPEEVDTMWMDAVAARSHPDA